MPSKNFDLPKKPAISKDEKSKARDELKASDLDKVTGGMKPSIGGTRPGTIGNSGNLTE